MKIIATIATTALLVVAPISSADAHSKHRHASYHKNHPVVSHSIGVALVDGPGQTNGKVRILTWCPRPIPGYQVCYPR